jgi:hypothetical protein
MKLVFSASIRIEHRPGPEPQQYSASAIPDSGETWIEWDMGTRE